MKVYDMARGCQYVDEKHHVCARRASWAQWHRIGDNPFNVSFRCVNHKYTLQNVSSRPVSWISQEWVDEYKIFTLGYKP